MNQIQSSRRAECQRASPFQNTLQTNKRRRIGPTVQKAWPIIPYPYPIFQKFILKVYTLSKCQKRGCFNAGSFPISSINLKCFSATGWTESRGACQRTISLNLSSFFRTSTRTGVLNFFANSISTKYQYGFAFVALGSK